MECKVEGSELSGWSVWSKDLNWCKVEGSELSGWSVMVWKDGRRSQVRY